MTWADRRKSIGGSRPRPSRNRASAIGAIGHGAQSRSASTQTPPSMGASFKSRSFQPQHGSHAAGETRTCLVTTTTTSVPGGTHAPSPPLIQIAVVFVALSLAGLVTNVLFARSTFVPSAYPPLDALQDYYTGVPGAIRLASFLQFGASIALAVFAACATSRLISLHVNAASVHIAFIGGALASGFLGLTAIASWALAHPGLDQATLRVVHQLAFAADAAHLGGLGLLVGGLSITSLAFGLMPRWLGLFGVLVAVLAELSVLTLILPLMAALLPVVHVLSWGWLIAAGVFGTDQQKSRL
jgi:hypothetical protein